MGHMGQRDAEIGVVDSLFDHHLISVSDAYRRALGTRVVGEKSLAEADGDRWKPGLRREQRQRCLGGVDAQPALIGVRGSQQIYVAEVDLIAAPAEIVVQPRFNI